MKGRFEIIISIVLIINVVALGVFTVQSQRSITRMKMAAEQAGPDNRSEAQITEDAGRALSAMTGKECTYASAPFEGEIHVRIDCPGPGDEWLDVDHDCGN
jgi:hypothetical protein